MVRGGLGAGFVYVLLLGAGPGRIGPLRARALPALASSPTDFWTGGSAVPPLATLCRSADALPDGNKDGDGSPNDERPLALAGGRGLWPGLCLWQRLAACGNNGRSARSRPSADAPQLRPLGAHAPARTRCCPPSSS